ncbi:putative monooxygenase p33MONOX isoform X1 [Girardinichthys multiradiatus]|uniref:putative monooxygenase p33MONOX isoform X1 n=1 Tax=Girardinichthys multiradiatus TaxID=208333 RepID=UPI001FAE1F91|nr:putative monooxygenase p33MONOX isoform X1 [Girardinichthys multiradiatus]XP_047235384.1 putative monooxygenase p33MONOX isoform X1 [Girardinichthys multiradiatus]
MAGSGDLPAIEGCGMGGMKLPVGMTRRALSYDDNLEAPMSTPPHDISINNLWRRPIIPERKFSQLAEEDEGGPAKQAAVQDGALFKAPAVVKTKASSIIMNSLITKQTQESMYKFEQTAGLTDTSYTPHKGLTAEETRHHHRMPESLQKLHIQSLEAREEKSSSAQSTPSNTPHSSPKLQRRGWFGSTSSEISISSSNSSVDMGGGGGVPGEPVAGGAVERWGVFGPRLPVQSSTPDLGSDGSAAAGFAIQAYRGAQKPTPMEVMKSQATRLADNPQRVSPPKMEIPTVEGRRQGARPHKLKPRDMNILTPSGF